MREWISDCGSARLIRGDCLEVLPTIEGVDAVVTDPPYGIGLGNTNGVGGRHGLQRDGYKGFADTYENFIDNIVPRINASLSLVERAAVFTGPHIHEQKKPDAIGGVYASAACGRHKWGFKNFLPVLLYGSAPDLHKGARFPTAIASNATAKKSDHPCPKPVEWMLWLVRLVSRDSETILDPFMGSGTTGVACVKTGRKFVGIELDRGYFDIAVKRIEKALADREARLPQEATA